MDEYLISSRRRKMVAGRGSSAPKVNVWRIVALPLLITLLLCLDVADAAERRRSTTTSKSVTALLDAKWSSTPILLEISEFLSEERKDYFWSFLDRITDLEPSFIRGGSDRDHYELVLREASTLISQDRTNFLKLALAMRSYSPTVEMFHQISLTKKLPPDCSAVIEVNNEFTCDISNLEQMLESSVQRNSSEMHTMDHHYPNGGGDSESTGKIKVILYGELGTETFREFHFILKENAKQGNCDYIVRHYMKRRPPGKVRLSGYGVELAIKSTEYKAQDDAVVRDDAVSVESKTNTSSDLQGEEIDEIDGFIISRLKKLHPDMSESLDQLRDHLLAGNQDLSPLKVWQLQDLGMQAAQTIASTSADEALGVMRDITQNFPLLSRSLIKTVVREELRQEILKNQNMFSQHLTLSSSDTALFVNGIFFDLDVSDVYSILEVMREEQRLMEQIHNLGVKNEQMEKILSLDLAISNHDYAVDIRDSAIMYLNNIEHDPQYSAWPSKMSDILRPTYPGVIRSIRKNIFHLVVIVDPSDIRCHDLLKLSESFYVHKAPIRVGLLLVVNRNLTVDGFADAGVAMLNALNFVVEERGTLYAGLSFLTDVYARVGDGKPVTPKDVITTFKLEFPSEDLEMIFGYESDYDTGRRLAWDFLERSGLKGLPEVLLNGVRLPKNQLNSDYFEEAVLTEVMQQTAFIQRAVYKGELSDTDDVLDFVMSRDIVVPRLNDRILNSSWNLLDVVGVSAVGNVKAKFADLSDSDMTATFTANLRYLVAKDDFAFRPVTIWVVTDLGAEVGRQLLLDGIEQMKTSNDIRLAFIDNSDNNAISNKISEAVNFAIESLPRKQSRLFVENILKEENVELIISDIKTPADFLKTESDKDDYKIWESSGGSGLRDVHGVYCRKVLKFLPGQTGLVVNGRIIGPFSDGERFNADDFNLLERHSLKTFGDKIRKVFEDVIHEGEKDSISDLAFKVSSMLFSRKSTRTRHQLKWSGDEHSVVKITPRDPQRPAFNLTAIVDPVSRGAQKIAQILSVFRDVLNCHVWVFLNAQNKLSEMPLNSFYRYVLDSQLQFTDDDKFSSGPIARFQNIPVKPLFTLHMDTPDNWLVELVKTPFDLDNIRLDEVDGNVYGEFELEHLLVEGHCFDQENGMPPRGLQFNLGNVDNPEMFDTIVMSNLGYFQLKAHPGAWTLRLRNGRSSEIYSVVGQEGTDSPQDSPEVQILIGNFRSHIVKIKVLKYPGKKGTDLLADDDDNGEDQNKGLWNSITSSFGAGSSKKDAGGARSGGGGGGGDDSSDDVINIFSVASGHLYERLLRIMMLSVMKHTKTPVKFWFLKNYLSPTFKDFLPYMSEAYGFEYELVQYKWPRWLHQQTEKQRTIWGYKILFLDVLFPLSVKKIIFVDADQVVRADLKDLRNFDLGGAPYGYTPFCESRREMDGYRFWKTGYWATHLQGRRYHISALYVVDLRRFRRIAAGDRLRGQYQGLSQDPNSLSNLDQDLPNNMIHQVAIKSLPQEWLWCETWCDDASKNAAKTIDLCNNPRTKEPKLSAAVRITPEWKGYDDEIKELLDRFNGFRAKGDGSVSDAKVPHRTDEDSRDDIHSEL